MKQQIVVTIDISSMQDIDDINKVTKKYTKDVVSSKLKGTFFRLNGKTFCTYDEIANYMICNYDLCGFGVEDVCGTKQFISESDLEEYLDLIISENRAYYYDSTHAFRIFGLEFNVKPKYFKIKKVTL